MRSLISLCVFLIGLVLGIGFHKWTDPSPSQPVQSSPTAVQRMLFDELAPEFADYDRLVDAQDKLDQANMILAKVMQIFIADIGLRQLKAPICQIGSSQTTSTTVSSEPTKLDPENNAKESPSTLESKVSQPDKKNAHRTNKTQVIPTKNARGAVHALYQAILWREPDSDGGANATRQFSQRGWAEYIRKARAMMRSQEFLRDIEPQYTPQQIINRMYAVYLGRCANEMEIKGHMNDLNKHGSTRVIEDVISKGRSFNEAQIFEGGFSTSSCPAT